MIIGSDLLQNMGIDITYSEELVEWLDNFHPIDAQKYLNRLSDG